MRKRGMKTGSGRSLIGGSAVLLAVIAAAGLLLGQTRLSVDNEKLKKELGDFVKEKIIASFSEDIEVDLGEFSRENLPADIEGGFKIHLQLEQKLKDATYINELLRDVKVLGYDLSEVSFVKLGVDYLEMDEKFRKVWLEGTREHKTKEQMIIESRRVIMESVSGLLGRAIDEKNPEISGEITSGLNSLLWDGYDKVKEVLETVDAFEKDPELDWSDALVKKLKISGDFFDYFQTFELNYRAFKDQVGDPAEAWSFFTILYRGLGAENPGDKIDAVIKMMSTFGGKVPVLGKFIEMYAQVAEEMLNAVGRLAEVLRKRQGYCVGTGTTGHIGSKYQDNRSLKFAEQFPNGGTACPAYDEGVYKDIYVDIDEPDKLYFWTGSSYIQGLPTGGIEAVKALIVWLRKTGHASEAVDAAFLGRAYNIAPGFLVRDREAKDLVEDLRARVTSLSGRLGMCPQEARHKFLLDIGRIRPVLRMLEFADETVESFVYEEDIIVDRIHDDAIFKGTDAFWTRAKELASHLNDLVIFTIEGRAVDEDGKPQSGMTVSVRPESNLLKDCSRMTTDGSGGFIATLYKHREESFEAVVQAESGEKKSDEARIAVEGTESVYTCTLPVESTAVAFLVLVPAEKTIAVGEKVIFKLQAELVDGTTKTIDNSRAVWSGAESGVFTATKVGEAFGVTATYREKTASAKVTVAERKPKTVTVTKNVAPVVVGSTVAFEAIATFDDESTENVTEDPETVFDPGKVMTYTGTGAAQVTATYRGVSGTIHFDVEAGNATLVIDPSSETLVVGDTILFKVYLERPQVGQEDVTAKCSPANPSFTATAEGQFNKTVSYALSPTMSLSATATITVKKMDRIIVEPATATVKIDETKDFTARAAFSDGTSADVTGRVVWTGGPRFQSNRAGTFAVTAAYGAATGSATVTVTDEKADDPCAPSNVLASIQKLTALVNNVRECRNRVDQYYTAFMQAAGSAGDHKICNLFKIAYCYANARSNAIRIVDFLLETEDLASEILMLYGICPDLAAGMKGQGRDINSIVALLGSVKGAGDASTAKVNAMLSRLNQDGCDPSDVLRAGENNVRPDQDPDFIQTLDGAQTPVCYDTWLWGAAPSQGSANWSLSGRAEGLAGFDIGTLRFAGQKQGSVTHPDGTRGTFSTTGNNIRIVMKKSSIESGKSVELTYTFIGSEAGGSLFIGTYTVEGSDGRRQRGNWRAVKK